PCRDTRLPLTAKGPALGRRGAAVRVRRPGTRAPARLTASSGSPRPRRGDEVKRVVIALAAASALVLTGAASAVSWETPVGTNVVADNVIVGGGYPVPPGATKPDPGTCRSGLYNANRSESW